MTQPHHASLVALGAGALGALLVVEFLLPRGEPLSYAALSVALFFFAAGTVAYVYAQWERAQEPTRDEALRPAVDRYVLAPDEAVVPESVLDGAAPLVALVRDGEVLHPEFDDWLAPYFADPAMAFVQTATYYRGEGRIADAFCAQEVLAQARATAKNSLNAAPLYGSGALVAREALREVYRPGMRFGELGLRLQALGYRSYFEPAPLVLASAPQTLEEYWPLLVRRAVRAGAGARYALSVRRLPFATRLQYLSDSAVYGATAATAAALALVPLMLLLRGSGPVIISSAAALPGLLVIAACLAAAAYTLKTAGIRIIAPAGLALAGTYLAAYSTARAGGQRLALGFEHLLAFARQAKGQGLVTSPQKL
ncbi:MAG: glycosyltransferase family 2 protein [Patescibacteria group bacterium]